MNVEITNPMVMGVVAVLGAAVALIAWRRRATIGIKGNWLVLAGMACAALAAGEPRWMRGDGSPVLVMVDLSASTRGATYRTREALVDRIAALLGDRAYRVRYFAEHQIDADTRDIPNGVELKELPGQRTVYEPSTDAPAVVLFSDGQFDLPKVAPPTFVVIDPGLMEPHDAAVRDLRIDEERAEATVSVSQAGRSLRWAGSSATEPIALLPGGERVWGTIAPGAVRVEAIMNAEDRWSENDSMRTVTMSESALPWWVGDGSAPSGFEAYLPQALPTDEMAYLSPPAVVLNNVPAGELGPVVQERLVRFVTEFGGALVVVGGDHAFGAGGYAMSRMEDLLPLSSAPPRPTIHWMLLTDASGSMDEPAGARSTTRWQMALEALHATVTMLPARDLLSVGGFSRDIRWWGATRSVREARSGSLTPADVHPSGPTNLQAALSDLPQANREGFVSQALLITDAQANIADPQRLGALLVDAKITLNVLLIGPGEGAAALQKIATATGGQTMTELRPDFWARAASQLVRTARPTYLQTDPTTVKYVQGTPAWADQTVSPWNRTWLKPDATLLAATQWEGQSLPMAASWRLGLGEVLAAGYAAPPDQVARWVGQLARRPVDPRFAVEVHPDANGWRLTVQVDDKTGPMAVTVDDGSTVRRMSAVAPGELTARVPAAAEPRLIRISVQGQTVQRKMLPGSYPPEFNAVGLNTEQLSRLAARTGGAIIPPAQQKPIDLPELMRPTPLSGVLSILAGGCWAIALVIWRRGLN